MFLGLTIWHWEINWWYLPQGWLPFFLSVSYSCLSRSEASSYSSAFSYAILVQPLFGQSCWWDFPELAFDITRRTESHNIVPCTLVLNLSYSFVQEYFVDRTGTGFYNFAFCLIVVFNRGLHLMLSPNCRRHHALQNQGPKTPELKVLWMPPPWGLGNKWCYASFQRKEETNSLTKLWYQWTILATSMSW